MASFVTVRKDTKYLAAQKDTKYLTVQNDTKYLAVAKDMRVVATDVKLFLGDLILRQRYGSPITQRDGEYLRARTT